MAEPRRTPAGWAMVERVRWKLWQAYLRARAVPKTLIFNFRYLPPRQAVRLPILVSHRTVLRRLGGRVTLRGPVRRSMVRIGFGNIDFFDRARSWAVWHVTDGEVIFEGDALIGHGCSVEAEGTLILGDGVQMMAESQVSCRDRIIIGPRTLISWQVLIMDSDHHAMLDGDGAPRPVTAPVEIGSDSWIGCRVTILKGVLLGPGTVVAAGATVHRSFPEGASLVGGTPGEELRTGVRWAP